jgi:hypothetical protein
VGGGDQNGFGMGGDGHGTGAEAGCVDGGAAVSECGVRRTELVAAEAGINSAQGGRLSGWADGWCAQAAGRGIGRLRTVCMKELGSAEAGDTVRSRGWGRSRCLRLGTAPEGRRTGRAGGWKGPQLRRRDRLCGQGRCSRRAGSAEGGSLSGRVAGGGSSCRGGGPGRLRTVPMKELGGAEAARHGPEPRAGEIRCSWGGCGLGTAPEDGGPGGRAVGQGRSFGGVPGLVVKDAAVAGQARRRAAG